MSDNPSYLSFGDGENVTYQEGVFVGYRYYDTKEMPVAFPFGYGLSYTSFSYDNLQIEHSEITDHDTVTVSVDVTNTGNMEGKEIVQLYVSDLTCAARRPVRELKGYEKVSLAPGERKTIHFTLDYRSFAWYNETIKDWYAASGDYQILIGASSRDLRLSGNVHMTTQKILPLKVHMNTTLGELLADERTAAYVTDFKRKLEENFEMSSSDERKDGTVAISDAMNNAMIGCMPLRNVISYGFCSKEELLEMINTMNRR